MSQKNYPPELRRIASKTNAKSVGFHSTGTPYIDYHNDNEKTNMTNLELENYRINGVHLGDNFNRIKFSEVK